MNNYSKKTERIFDQDQFVHCDDYLKYVIVGNVAVLSHRFRVELNDILWTSFLQENIEEKIPELSNRFCGAKVQKQFADGCQTLGSQRGCIGLKEFDCMVEDLIVEIRIDLLRDQFHCCVLIAIEHVHMSQTKD